MAAVPLDMLAVLAEGSRKPLRLVQMSTPRPGPGEVLVRVVASAVNPLDTKILAGIADHARQPLPAVLGIDMAGTVVDAGQGTEKLREGDAVKFLREMRMMDEGQQTAEFREKVTAELERLAGPKKVKLPKALVRALREASRNR